MTSSGAMSKLLQTLTPRPMTPRPPTPDLTSLDFYDPPVDASSLLVPLRARTRGASLDHTAGVFEAGRPARVPAPTRPAPPAPARRPSCDDGHDGSPQPTGRVPAQPLAAGDSALSGLLLPSVEPLRTGPSAHRWLARYLLDGPAPSGPSQRLAEDMLGAGILGASVTGAKPLVRPRGFDHQRPLDQFKGFVDCLSQWVAEGPESKRAMYQIFAIKLGRARMHYARTLEVQCLGVETLPNVLGECTHLQKIDARGNCLKDVPKNMGALHALRELNLEGNLFTRVPDAIAKLSLDVLRLDVAAAPLCSPCQPSVDPQGRAGWL